MLTYLFACRNLCCLVAVEICRLCACGVIVLVLPTTGNGLADETGHFPSGSRRAHLLGSIQRSLIKFLLVCFYFPG